MSLPPQGKMQRAVRYTVKGLEQMIDKNWCLASYLILNLDFHEFEELAQRELPANFANRMATLVYGYMCENKLPPTEIQQVVLNVSEDIAAGRDVALRAGDYIAVQKYFRANR